MSKQDTEETTYTQDGRTKARPGEMGGTMSVNRAGRCAGEQEFPFQTFERLQEEFLIVGCTRTGLALKASNINYENYVQFAVWQGSNFNSVIIEKNEDT